MVDWVQSTNQQTKSVEFGLLSETFYGLIVGLSVGIPVAVMAVAVLVGVVYSVARRRSSARAGNRRQRQSPRDK